MPSNQELERICNTAGYPMYPWAFMQLSKRSELGSQKDRDDDNLIYLANKGAWIRIVSSVNLTGDSFNYFKNIAQGLQSERSLAENFILYGGTSTYAYKSQQLLRETPNDQGVVETYEVGDLQGSKTQGMNLRSGLDAYNLTGDQEIRDFGYRPMPGITSVTVDSTGRMGSLRQATVNFKVWDRRQFDIMDALYFRLGFTVLIEWGHAKYYDNKGNLQSSEEYMINPFKDRLTKEEIQIQLNTNTQKAAGNYGGMLGVVTNFNYTITEDGGYDCSVTVMALGSVLGSFPINHAAVLPDTYYEQLTQLLNQGRNTEIAEARIKAEQDQQKAIQDALNKINSSKDVWGIFLQQNAEKLKNEDLSLLNLTFNTKNLVFNKNVNLVDAPGNISELRAQIKADIAPVYDDVISSADEYKKSHDISGYVSSTSSNVRAYYFETKDNSGVIYFDQPGIQKKYITAKNVEGQGNQPIIVKLDISAMNLAISSQNTKPDSSDKKISTFGNFFDTLRENGNQITYFYENNGINLGPYAISIEYDERQPALSKADMTNPNTTWEIISVQSNVNSQNRNENGQKVGTMDLKIELGTYKNSSNITPSNVSGSLVSVGTTAGITPTNQTNRNRPFDYKITIGSHFSTAGASGYLGDLSFIKEVVPYPNNQPLITDKAYDEYTTAISNAEKAKQAYLDSQSKDVDARYNQEQLKTTIQGESTIELMLRSLLVYAINSTGKNNKQKLNKYIAALFSEGAYKKFFQDGIPQKKTYTSTDLKNYVQGNMTAEKRLEMNMMYGNNFSLMSCENILDDNGNVKDDYLSSLPQVDFNKLFELTLIKYGKTADIDVVNKPDACVYINLGLFFLMLNHTGVLYNTDTQNALDQNKVITPMAYIDFNPETNYYLSSENQISVNPYKFLVRFPSTKETYKKLFDKDLIKDGKITYKTKQYVQDQEEPQLFTKTESLFDPKNDKVSKYLPDTKSSLEKQPNGFIGKLMNIQVEISYLLSIMNEYRTSSDSHEVYFQKVIETVIFDINKNMGNYNAYRLSYNDAANCYQITDDQLQSKPHSSLSSVKSQMIEKPERFEIPVYGLKSIARRLSINSDLSSRLASYLAISSNPGIDTQVATSRNTTDFGVYNTGSYDRYTLIKTDGTSTPNKNNIQNSQAAELAVNFNSVISKIYSLEKTSPLPDEPQNDDTIRQNIADSDIDRALGYYIDRMAKVKNEQEDTAHAMIIPLNVNITMDGMSGIYPFQLFTIDENILPYRYSSAALALNATNQRRVAFVITKIVNEFTSNEWTTALQGKMVLLKNDSKTKDQPLQVQEEPQIPQSGVVSISTADFTITREEIIKKVVAKLKSFGYSDIVIAGFLGNFEVETSFVASKIFSESADPKNSLPNIGLAQWQGGRKNQLVQKYDYNTIEGQMDFLQFELTQGNFQDVGKKLKNLTDREEDAMKAADIIRKDYEKASTDLQYKTSYDNRVAFALNFLKELRDNKY